MLRRAMPCSCQPSALTSEQEYIIHTRTRAYINICTNGYMNIHICIHTMSKYMNSRIVRLSTRQSSLHVCSILSWSASCNACMYIYIWVRIHIRECIYIHTCTHAHIRIHICMHVSRNMEMHTYIYMQTNHSWEKSIHLTMYLHTHAHKCMPWWTYLYTHV